MKSKNDDRERKQKVKTKRKKHEEGKCVPFGCGVKTKIVAPRRCTSDVSGSRLAYAPGISGA